MSFRSGTSLADNNTRLVIEGARGVGTTSFANYLKFQAQQQKLYLSPRDEVSVEENWNLEALLTAVISNIVREMEVSFPQKVKKNKVYLEAKAISNRLSEAYNTFGITAFSIGGNFGRTASVTQPTFIPATVLKHQLEDLGKLAVRLGYKNGILVQLNNLDLNVIHSEAHLSYLFNAIRDYLQIENISWFLVGDIGLRVFIAKKIDRLDDIISYDILIKPLRQKLYHELINKRLDFYKITKKAEFPLGKDTFDYLYDLAEGRLRYIFGLVYSIVTELHIGKLIQYVSFDLAKSTVIALTKDRISKFNLSDKEEKLIKTLVKLKESNVAKIAEETKIDRTYISKMASKLLEDKLVTVKQVGKHRFYTPSLDAKIAFSGD